MISNTGLRIIKSIRRSKEKFSHRLWGPPSLLFKGHRCHFPAVKRNSREADRAYPSTAEDRNEWEYTSLPPMRLYVHGVQGTNCFYLLLYLWIIYQKIRVAAFGDSITII
jgi:hypothetical protein